MKVERLKPQAEHRTKFAWSHYVALPTAPGCYALVTYGGDVLYVGLATTSIRNRVEAHLDSALKRQGTEIGVPFWVDYVVRPRAEVNRIERGWMNVAILEDGDIPPLNRVYSPL
jgi:hypothetical protein